MKPFKMEGLLRGAGRLSVYVFIFPRAFKVNRRSKQAEVPGNPRPQSGRASTQLLRPIAEASAVSPGKSTLQRPENSAASNQRRPRRTSDSAHHRGKISPGKAEVCGSKKPSAMPQGHCRGRVVVENLTRAQRRPWRPNNAPHQPFG